MGRWVMRRKQEKQLEGGTTSEKIGKEIYDSNA
jgi:hypothetical protein